MTVDFPAPLGPTRARVWPGGTARDRSASTGTSGRLGKEKCTADSDKAPMMGSYQEEESENLVHCSQKK